MSRMSYRPSKPDHTEPDIGVDQSLWVDLCMQDNISLHVGVIIYVTLVYRDRHTDKVAKLI